MTSATAAELEQPQVVNKATGVRRILVAEDNDGMRHLLARAMRASGHDVVQARNGLELMHWIDLMTQWRQTERLFDLVITDLRMPMYSGQECLDQLHLSGDATPVILITAFGDEKVHKEALASGACAVLDKPLDLGQLRFLVAQVFC